MNNRSKCTLMWRWIVDHPGSSKGDWAIAHPESAWEIEDHNDCYACLENDEIGGDDYNCNECPVNWDKKGGECLNSNSPYTDWENWRDHNVEDAIKVLKVIEDTWLDKEEE